MNLRELARHATAVENGGALPEGLPEGDGLVIGITGPPGAGKSSLADALTQEFRRRGKTVAVIAVDPSSRSTGGAILGDRIRMQRHHADPGVFIRSMATRGAPGGLARTSAALSRLFRGAGFDITLVETIGVGQDEVEIASHADVTLVVLVPGMGDDIQSIKAGLMEVADIFVINKADRPGADQLQREIESMLSLGVAEVPVFRTVAIEGTGRAGTGRRSFRAARRKTNGALSGWEIDHVGIAVESLEQALPFYETQLGMEAAVREIVEHEGVSVAMLPAGAARIELLEPLSGDSTIARFLAKRGPGLHHIALRVPDLPGVIARLEKAGARLLGEPRRGAGGHLYVFVHPASTGGVLWELIQA